VILDNMGLTAAKKTEYLNAYNAASLDIQAHLDWLDEATEENITLDEYELRNEQVHPLYNQLKTASDHLITDATEQEQPDLIKKVSDFKKKYFSLMGRLRSRIRELQPTVLRIPQTQGTNDFRCPKLELKKFDGKIENWATFRDMFDSMINHNEKLSKIQKFHYLVTSVELPSGQPNVLEGFQVCEAQYDEAWKAICTRYEDMRKILNAHVSSMFAIKKMVSESASELRRVLDGFSCQLKSLDTHGFPIGDDKDFGNLLIVHMVVSRLDDAVVKEWRKHNKHDSATWKEISTFLTDHWKGLDDTTGQKKAVVKGGESKQTPTTTKPSQSKSHFANDKGTGGKCVVCEN
jgi:hypothetical protein